MDKEPFNDDNWIYELKLDDSRSIMDRPLLKRKERLQMSVRENGRIAVSRYIHTDDIDLFRAADEK